MTRPKRGLRAWAACIVALGASTRPDTARAQAVAEALQFAVKANVASFDHMTITSRYPAGNFDFETTSWQAGLGKDSTLGLEFGYGLDDHWVLGGLAAVTSSSSSWDEGTRGNGGTNDRRRLSFLAGPKLDYMFGSASSVRPFAGAALGFVERTDREQSKWFVPSAEVPGPYHSTDPDSSLAGLDLAARLGLRWFVAPWLSIDPALSFDASFLWGHGPHSANADAHATAYDFGASIAASGWWGR